MAMRLRQGARVYFHALLGLLAVIFCIGLISFAMGLKIQGSIENPKELDKIFWWPGLVLMIISLLFVPCYIFAMKELPMTRCLMVLWTVFLFLTAALIFVTSILTTISLFTAFLNLNECFYTNDGATIVPSSGNCFSACEAGLRSRYAASGEAVCCCCKESGITQADENFVNGDRFCDTWHQDKTLARVITGIDWIAFILLFALFIYSLVMIIVCSCCACVLVWEDPAPTGLVMQTPSP